MGPVELRNKLSIFFKAQSQGLGEKTKRKTTDLEIKKLGKKEKTKNHIYLKKTGKRGLDLRRMKNADDISY